MKIEQFEFLCSVVENHSMSKAAVASNTSIQNISKNIISLEKELNTKIFSRNSYGVFLTTEGEEIFQYAKKIVDDVNQLKIAYMLDAKTKDNEMKTIHIISAMAMENSIIKVIFALKKRKNLQCSFITDDAAEINFQFDNNREILFEQYDIIISGVFSHMLATYQNACPNVPLYRLDKGRLGVEVNRNSIIARNSCISIKQILPYQLALLTTAKQHSSLVQQALNNININIQPQITANSARKIQEIIQNDKNTYAFTFYKTQELGKEDEDSQVLTIPLTQNVSLDYILIMSPSFSGTEMSKAIIDECKKIYPHFQKI